MLVLQDQEWEKCSFAHRQVDEQPTKRSKTNDDKSAVALLKKGNWPEREPVTDEYHDRPGKPGKKGDKKLGQISSKRQFYSPEGHRHAESQSNGRSSRRLLHVIPKFETKILRSVTFVQVNLMSVAPTLRNLRIVHKKRQRGKSKVPAKQRGSWPKEC